MGDRARALVRGAWLGCMGLAAWAAQGVPMPALAQAGPPLRAVANEPGAAAAGTIDLDITSAMGDGQTFREGDPLSFLVSSDRGAHLVLIIEEADGTLVRLVPNRHASDALSAGPYTEIPDPSAGDRWRVGPPFGHERVWAFAASAPFPDLPGVPRADGTLRLSLPLDEVRTRLRAHGARPDVAYGEAGTTLTTVPTGRPSGGR